MIQRDDLKIGQRVSGTHHGQDFTGEIRSLAWGTAQGWSASIRLDGTVTSPAGRSYGRVRITEKDRNSSLELVG